MIEAYPLNWPYDYPRSKNRLRGRFRTTFARARDGVVAEIKRLGGKNAIISTNIPLKLDGMPYATFRPLEDTGVAVYFTFKNNSTVLCCDKWLHVEDNLYAVQLTIEAMRGMDRWGCSEMLNRIFTGFKALADPNQQHRHWTEIFGATLLDSYEKVKSIYREKCMECHPDKPTGSAEKFHELQNAWKEFEKYNEVRK